MLHKVLEHIVNLTMRSLEERLSLLDGSNYPQLWRTKAPSSGQGHNFGYHQGQRRAHGDVEDCSSRVRIGLGKSSRIGM